MSNIKERLFGAIAVMGEDEARRLWDYILAGHADPWNKIGEEAPDEIDLAMIYDAENDPECSVMASDEEAVRVMEE